MDHRPPSDPPSRPTLETLDRERLEARVREAAQAVLPDRWVDEMEVRHLLHVVTECSLLLTDVYSEQRIARIMHPDRGALSSMIDRLLEEERQGQGEVLYRIRRLPDDVRVVGDMALFDLGLRGLRRVKGYDLAELGARAYRMAGHALELLAEDRRLREFFKQNRLLMLPLEEEVVFLNQCSEKLPFYADILRRLHGEPQPARPASREDLGRSVPLMAAAAEALGAPEAATVSDAYAEAARGELALGAAASRDLLISNYERMVLFSSLDVGRLREALRGVVVDQDAAVESLCDEFSLFATGTRDPRKPAAYFLVGPTGVGKNHLVERLCRLLEGVWGRPVPMLTIEGPAYTYPSDINELRGATRGFIRSDEEGLLTAFHEKSSRSPLAVILVDEVEKAHPQLRTFFLSILDRGTTTDNRGQVLDFSNTMVFFTSNLGYSDAQQRSSPIGYLDEGARQSSSDQDVRRDLRRGLSPEFMNRVRIIHFGRLTRASAERILDLELERILRRYRDLHGVEVRVTRAAREELLRRGFSAEFGARHLASTLESVCNVELAKKIRRDDRRSGREDESLVRWLRELREEGRAFDPAEVRRHVLDRARAQLPYAALRIEFDGDAFRYVGEGP